MIHQTAIAGKSAKIGKDVSIGPYSVIDEKVEIGDGCIIGPHVCICKYTTMGSGCKVHAGAVIGDVPQDLAFRDAETFVKIGKNCVIREGVTIHRGTKPGTATEIGDDCFLMANSHFAHNVRLLNNVIVANGALLAGYVEVGERAFISGNACLHQFIRIGRMAMIGGGCAISKDVPPFCTVAPASYNIIAGMNIIGMKRNGFTAEDRAEVKKAFKTLYVSGFNFTQAVEQIKTGQNHPAVKEFCDFIRASKRGICSASLSDLTESEE